MVGPNDRRKKVRKYKVRNYESPEGRCIPVKGIQSFKNCVVKDGTYKNNLVNRKKKKSR